MSLTHSGDDEDSEDSGVILLFFLGSPESSHRTQLKNVCVLHWRHGSTAPIRHRRARGIRPVLGRPSRRPLSVVRTTADSRQQTAHRCADDSSSDARSPLWISQLTRTKANAKLEWPDRFEGGGGQRLHVAAPLRRCTAAPLRRCAPLRHCAAAPLRLSRLSLASRARLFNFRVCRGRRTAR